jgi:hypothetical protein
MMILSCIKRQVHAVACNEFTQIEGETVFISILFQMVGGMQC